MRRHVRRGRPGRGALQAVAAAVVAILAVATPATAYVRPGHTELVDVDASGKASLGADRLVSTTADITPGGRYVAFSSDAADLSGIPDQAFHVFLRDRTSGTTRMADVSSDGKPALCLTETACSTAPNVSADGRFVAFTSEAPNLVSGDTNQRPDVFLHDMTTGRTTRVSVGTSGAQGDDGSWLSSLSPDGRFAVFVSAATNLVKTDTNGQQDVFVRDLRRNRTTRVSVASNGAQADGWSTGAQIAANDRDVVFSSTADNLVAGDTNGAQDVFLHDLRTGRTERESVGSGGTEATATFPPNAGRAQVSADGRFVAFMSSATNLVPNYGVTNVTVPRTRTDLYVHDRRTGRTTRVSTDSDGAPTWAGGYGTSGDGISANGRFVLDATTFGPEPTTQAPPLDDPNDYDAVLRYDRMTGESDWVSWTTGRKRPQCTAIIGSTAAAIFAAGMDATGRSIGLISCAADMTSTPYTPLRYHVFLHDAGPTLGEGGFGGTPPDSPGTCAVACTPQVCVSGICLPPEGAWSGLDASTDVRPVLTSQGANLYGASVAYRPGRRDLYARIELRDMPSVNGTPAAGASAILYGLDLRANGRRYEIRAQRVVGPAYDQAGGASFGLFRQNAGGTWQQVADLRGGYGTTGEEIDVSIPLRALGIGRGGQLSGLRAFTAVGTFDAGPAVTLDALRWR